MDDYKLSGKQLDVLREIGNIGAGNAATSMSKLINKRIYMEVPSVNIVTFNEITEIVGGPEKPIVAMFFKIYGKVQGSVYFIISIQEAESLVSQITQGQQLNLFSDHPNEMAISALKEFGNIMTGSYLTALSDFMNINMQSSIPYLSIDMAGAVLTEGLFQFSNVSDHAIVIDTEIHHDYANNGLKGHFFLLPDYDSFPNMFSVLGIPGHG